MSDPITPAPATPAPAAPATPAPVVPAPATPAPASAPAAAPAPAVPAPAAPAPKPGDSPAPAAAPADDKSKAKPGDAPAEPVVPEKYEFKAPEGMALDEAVIKAFEPVAKELKLTQEGAQKIADVYAAHVKAQTEAAEQRHKDFLESEKQETVKALGANHQEQMAFAAKVRNHYFPATLMEIFDATGLSNNKDFNLALIKMGKTISEDLLVEGKGKGEGITAEDLFPSMKKN